MIDFERFWAEQGALPGMTEAETLQYLEQMAPWARQQGVPPEAMFPDGLYPGAGVTDEQVTAWEAERGVRLPEVLREALRRQGGGYVRDSHVRVLPLARMCPGDRDLWEWVDSSEEDVTNRELVLRFAEEEEFGGAYFLNYNTRGPQGEPSVLIHYSDPGTLGSVAESVTKFFGRLLRTTDAPKVDWSETESLEILARETLDLSAIHGGPATCEQVLCRQEGALVVLVHEQAPKEEKFTRTTLPLPLQKGGFGVASIRPHRPAPVRTFGLHLQPQNTEGIVEVESQRTRDGKWKNSTLRGAPIYVLFESTDKARLETLQRKLFGAEGADHARAEDERQEQFQQRMAALSPAEQQATMMQLFLQTRERFIDPAGLPPDAPPELAAAA
ncbi:MAG TPA: SMI1/KNR4 family protein, partial [Gemmataceae bacterium]|nr:SMI1/KNR4 family protein [Gemmataceae bacterium]